MLAITLPILLLLASNGLLLAASLLWLPALLAWSIRPATEPARWMRHAPPDTSGPGVLATGWPPPIRRVLLVAIPAGMACWAAVIAVRAAIHPANVTAIGTDIDVLNYVSWLILDPPMRVCCWSARAGAW